MNPLSFIPALLFSYASFILPRSLAAYDKNSKFKFISLKSEFLAQCLIPKQSGYVKVADRKKISLFSFIFYILFALLVIALVLTLVLPDVPCEEFTAYFGRRAGIRWAVDTLNEKLFVMLPTIFFTVEFLAFLLMGVVTIIKHKTESKKTIALIIGFILVLIFLLAFFIFMLF